jgi:hypothetical protein
MGSDQEQSSPGIFGRMEVFPSIAGLHRFWQWNTCLMPPKVYKFAGKS